MADIVERLRGYHRLLLRVGDQKLVAEAADTVDRQREALTKAAAQFELYAREHREKARAAEFNGLAAASEASVFKAVVNDNFAAMCRSALSDTTREK